MASTTTTSTKSSFKIHTKSPVLVTGATGYVAGVLIKELLENGVTVHGAVRDPSKLDKLQHLIHAADQSPGQIKFFKGDLLQEGSYEDGMKGCSIVFHTASPFTTDYKDPQKELVDPAVQGTRNVLQSATQTPSVKRVILTSSCVAIYGDVSDQEQAPHGVLTEDCYNLTGRLDYQPYSYSKTMAELAAWQMAGSQRQWTLVTINPSLVMGPGLQTHRGSESFKILKNFGDGTLASGTPNACFGVVDVREVAHAHAVAAYDESTAGRYIVNGTNTGLVEMGKALSEKFSNYPLPPRRIPKTLWWLIGPWVAGFSRRYIQNNVDVPIHLDNMKSRNELGIEYRPLSDTLCDMFQQMVEAGDIEKK